MYNADVPDFVNGFGNDGENINLGQFNGKITGGGGTNLIDFGYTDIASDPRYLGGTGILGPGIAIDINLTDKTIKYRHESPVAYIANGFNNIQAINANDNPFNMFTGQTTSSVTKWTFDATPGFTVNGISVANMAQGVGGPGVENYTVKGTLPQGLTLDGGGGSDTYTVNFGNLNGPVNIADSGPATIILNGVTNAPNELVPVKNGTTTVVTRANSTDQPVTFQGIKSGTINGGPLPNQFIDPGGTNLTLVGGTGDNSFILRNTTGPVNADGGGGSNTYAIYGATLQGPVTVSDSTTTGTDSVTIIGSTGPDTFTQTGNQVSVNGMSPVTLGAGIKSVVLDAGGGNGQVVVNGAPPVPFTTTTLTVPNDFPTAVANGPYVITEGSSLSLSAAGSADPDGDPLSYAWDLTGDGIFDDAFGPNPTLSWPQLVALGIDEGIHPNGVRVRVSDGQFTTDSIAAPLTVQDVAPSVGTILAPVDPLQIGTPISTSAGFTDPGTTDTHTATWNWGDGPSWAGTVTESNGSGTVTGSHTYAVAGVYTVALTVADDDGSSGQSAYQFVVVYDPSAGFVTGGGWINSPAGAFPANPALTGKANFGFVARYQNGATVPTGNTEFQFQLGNIDFKSTSYDWLVVSGAKARYHGVGTINGAGSYGFELTAWDGQVSGGGGTDRFRIKIWDQNQGNSVVYDNQMGAADGADPTTVLGGGSIVIHSGGPPQHIRSVIPPSLNPALSPGSLPAPVAGARGRERRFGTTMATLNTVNSRIIDLGRNFLGLADGHSTLGLDNHTADWGVFVDPTPGDKSGFTQPGEPGERKRLGRLAGKHGIDHNSGHDAGVVTAEARSAGIHGAPQSRLDLLTANGLPEEFDFAPVAVGQIRGSTQKF
jgi:hypothetical protein